MKVQKVPSVGQADTIPSGSYGNPGTSARTGSTGLRMRLLTTFTTIARSFRSNVISHADGRRYLIEDEKQLDRRRWTRSRK